ncbi:MAG TPA: NAD(P)H-binding protein [Trueperaceae bacterium]|nr:NAD(P)H-binding protein [Trueperaceae bacterium]
MTLLVFGASGRTGRQLVRQALERGHNVRAFARTPGKVGLEHERLELSQGDVQDAAAVDRAVAGVDAVLSVLGPTENKPGAPITRGTSNIVTAMKRHAVRRLLITAGAGVGDPLDRPRVPDRLINRALKLLAKHVYEDMLGAVEVVRSSDLEWTVVRVPRLTDGPTGKVRVGYLGGDVGTAVTRSAVTAFILDELEAGAWLRAAPVISG